MLFYQELNKPNRSLPISLVMPNFYINKKQIREGCSWVNKINLFQRNIKPICKIIYQQKSSKISYQWKNIPKLLHQELNNPTIASKILLLKSANVIRWLIDIYIQPFLILQIRMLWWSHHRVSSLELKQLKNSKIRHISKI